MVFLVILHILHSGILDGKLVSGYSQETNPLANKGANGYSPVGVMLSRNMLKKELLT